VFASRGANTPCQVAFAPTEQTQGMFADPALWRLLAGLMFTAFAFTMAWRFFRRRRRPRR
jgi:hypothetical protein